jgi:hypothetical protein
MKRVSSIDGKPLIGLCGARQRKPASNRTGERSEQHQESPREYDMVASVSVVCVVQKSVSSEKSFEGAQRRATR